MEGLGEKIVCCCIQGMQNGRRGLVPLRSAVVHDVSSIPGT